MREHCFRFCLLLIVMLAVRLALPSQAFAQSDGDLSPVEQWVLEQVALGRIANLDQPQFPNKEDRTLSADFLVRLLENPDIEMTRYGVRIQNAVFEDPLELAYIEVDSQLWLEDCEFNGNVSFYESRFARDLYFRGSTFHSSVDFTFLEVGRNFIANNARFLAKEQTADFNSMKVGGLLFLQGAEFAGAVDFIAAKIGGNFEANGARFTNNEQKANFNSLIVDGSALLPNVEFAGAVDFIAAKIAGSFDANGARFTHNEQKANFNSVKVDGNVFLQTAEFSGPADFVYAQIGNTFNATDAQFDNAQQLVSFNSMKVDGNIFMRNAEFAGGVDFIRSQIGGNFEANGARFTSKEQLVSFNSMRVDGSVFLLKAEFAGGVDFIRSQIGGSFIASGAHFSNTEQKANFSNMKVDNDVFLYQTENEEELEAEFAGPVDFISAQIGGSFTADSAHFKHTEYPANFNSIEVSGDVFLREARFAGPVIFWHAHIGSAFVVDDAHFNNKQHPASFNSMKVDGNIFLHGAEFEGPVDFNYVEVQNNFEAENTKFQSIDSEPSFNNMIVRGEIWFVGTLFMHGADLDNAVFLDLTIRGVEPETTTISDLRLSQTVVERKLDLESLEIQNLFSRSLRVDGRTNITNVDFLNSADFENSQFGDLHVTNVDFRTPGLKNINLGGMSYQNIQMILESNDDAWEELIDLIDRSTYNAQAYTTLENYFLQQGYADRADAVYIAYKRRELREGLSFGSMGWWSNLFLSIVGYGRNPGFALLTGVPFVMIGWLLVFRKSEGMVTLSKREIVRPNVGHRGTLSRKISKRVIFSQYEGSYSPFWYSLDLFIPFVDLGYDDKWAPRPNRKWALAYAKLLTLLGWILIPVGLLAITGIIK